MDGHDYKIFHWDYSSVAPDYYPSVTCTKVTSSFGKGNYGDHEGLGQLAGQQADRRRDLPSVSYGLHEAAPRLLRPIGAIEQRR